MTSKSNQDATPGPWRCRCGKGREIRMLEDGGNRGKKTRTEAERKQYFPRCQKNGKEKEKERKT